MVGPLTQLEEKRKRLAYGDDCPIRVKAAASNRGRGFRCAIAWQGSTPRPG